VSYSSWQISYAFQQCENFENRLRFDKVTERQFEGGNFVETQCSELACRPVVPKSALQMAGRDHLGRVANIN